MHLTGSVVHLMSRDGVEKVLNVLMQLLKHTEWEARHGGLLGLKYLLAVRQVWKCIKICLQLQFFFSV